VGDGGWTFAHDNGRKALEKEFGDKIVTSFVEKVPESADAERVIRDMAGQGNKLIFGTTFGYMEPMLKAAADLKDVKFEHATGYKTAENMRTYDSRTYQGAQEESGRSQSRSEGRHIRNLERPDPGSRRQRSAGQRRRGR
jgi:simple sugar transport system substrate-binding protein